MNQQEWVWMPHPAHFICASNCRFVLATYVNGYIVSTVGEYLPDETVREIIAESRRVKLEGKGDARRHDFLQKLGYEPLGANPDSLYETMVFKARPSDEPDSCCPYHIIVEDDREMERYATPKQAHDGHMRYCHRYAKIQ